MAGETGSSAAVLERPEAPAPPTEPRPSQSDAAPVDQVRAAEDLAAISEANGESGGAAVLTELAAGPPTAEGSNLEAIDAADTPSVVADGAPPPADAGGASVAGEVPLQQTPLEEITPKFGPLTETTTEDEIMQRLAETDNWQDDEQTREHIRKALQEAAEARRIQTTSEQSGVGDPSTSETPEVTIDIPARSEQLRNLTHQILAKEENQAAAALADQLGENPSEERKNQVYTADENKGKVALAVIRVVENVGEGEEVNILGENETLMVGERTVTRIGKRTGDSFSCIIEGSADPAMLTRQELIDAQLLAEADNILPELVNGGTPEGEIIRLDIESLRAQQDAAQNGTELSDPYASLQGDSEEADNLRNTLKDYIRVRVEGMNNNEPMTQAKLEELLQGQTPEDQAVLRAKVQYELALSEEKPAPVEAERKPKTPEEEVLDDYLEGRRKAYVQDVANRVEQNQDIPQTERQVLAALSVAAAAHGEQGIVAQIDTLRRMKKIGVNQESEQVIDQMIASLSERIDAGEGAVFDLLRTRGVSENDIRAVQQAESGLIQEMHRRGMFRSVDGLATMIFGKPGHETNEMLEGYYKFDKLTGSELIKVLLIMVGLGIGVTLKEGTKDIMSAGGGQHR